MAVSFTGGGSWSTLRKTPTCLMSQTNFITKVVSGTHRHECMIFVVKIRV